MPACNIEKTGGPDIGYIVRNKSSTNTLQLFLVVIKHWYLSFKLQRRHQCFAAHQISEPMTRDSRTGWRRQDLDNGDDDGGDASEAGGASDRDVGGEGDGTARRQMGHGG